MKFKTIVAAVLLAFVAASVVYLVVREAGPVETAPQANERAASTEQGQPGAASETGRNKVVVYYFHGNTRCATCRTIEAYAKEAVETGFPEALTDGRLEWRAVNVDERDNEHFVRDFQLTTRSVVLERLADGKRKDWKNLQRVWELVRGDKAAFLKYVQDETRPLLEAGNE